MKKVALVIFACLSLSSSPILAINPYDQNAYVDAIAELDTFMHNHNYDAVQNQEIVQRILNKALPQQLLLIIDDDYYPEWIRINAQFEQVRRGQIQFIANLVAQSAH